MTVSMRYILCKDSCSSALIPGHFSNKGPVDRQEVKDEGGALLATQFLLLTAKHPAPHFDPLAHMTMHRCMQSRPFLFVEHNKEAFIGCF